MSSGILNFFKILFLISTTERKIIYTMPKFMLDRDSVAVPVYFIENCLNNASGSFLKVYLYTLNLASKGIDADTQSIATALDMLESDVIQAINYWKTTGMIVEDSGIIEFCNKPFIDIPKDNSFEETTLNQSQSEEKKHYDSIEIASHISSDSALSEMVILSQELLAKTLTTTELETLYWLYDGLGFCAESILLILDYCISRDKKSIRYIEKVAIAWHEKGILTPEDIMDNISKEEEKNTLVYKIRKAMGIADRPLSNAEEEFFSKWCDEYNTPEEMIMLAYEHCLLNTSKLSLPYMDKIIERWHSQGIKTRADAEEDNKRHKTKKTADKKVLFEDAFEHGNLEHLTRKKN